MLLSCRNDSYESSHSARLDLQVCLAIQRHQTLAFLPIAVLKYFCRGNACLRLIEHAHASRKSQKQGFYAFPHRQQNGRSTTCWWQNILHKHEDGLLWADLDPLSNDIDKLSHREVGRHKISAHRPKLRSILNIVFPAPTLGSTCKCCCDCQRDIIQHWPHFFLSISGISLLSAFSTMTCM